MRGIPNFWLTTVAKGTPAVGTPKILSIFTFPISFRTILLRELAIQSKVIGLEMVNLKSIIIGGLLTRDEDIIPKFDCIILDQEDPDLPSSRKASLLPKYFFQWHQILSSFGYHLSQEVFCLEKIY